MISEIRARTLVCLTGFMGSGKSTVARLLARQVGWQHVDLDKRIIEATGQTIPISSPGSANRNSAASEHDQLARILGEAAEQQKPRIVSLGGGTIAQQQNVALLRQSGAVLIWLHVRSRIFSNAPLRSPTALCFATKPVSESFTTNACLLRTRRLSSRSKYRAFARGGTNSCAGNLSEGDRMNPKLNSSRFSAQRFSDR